MQKGKLDVKEKLKWVILTNWALCSVEDRLVIIVSRNNNCNLTV